MKKRFKAYQCNDCKHSFICEGRMCCGFGWSPYTANAKECKESFEPIEKEPK